MDAIIIYLCDLLMTYYSGLTFITWGRSRRYTTMHDRVFADYYGIQYNDAGPMRFAQGGEALHAVEGPHAFFTYPGERFRYGTLEDDGPRDHLFVCFRGPHARMGLRGGRAGSVTYITSPASSQSSSTCRPRVTDGNTRASPEYGTVKIVKNTILKDTGCVKVVH